jgi:DNA polymerase-1
MIAAFRNGIDLHALTASRMLRKPIEEVISEERSNAKPINFGAIYGEGAPGLVKSVWKTQGRDMSEAEAREWLDVFANTYPDFAKKWRKEHYLRCKAAGHIVIGRDADRGVGRIVPLSRIPPDRSDYTASCNYPIQGTCADAAMRAITAIDDMLFEAGIDGGLVAFIHDELILEVAKADASRAAELLEKAMNDAFEETFPGSRELGLLNGLVEAKIGANWARVK